MLHKILLMEVGHWPRREAHYGEIAGFEHGPRGLSVSRNPDIQMDSNGLGERLSAETIK